MITSRTRSMVLHLLGVELARAQRTSAILQAQAGASASRVHPGVKGERIKAKRIAEAIAQVEAVPVTATAHALPAFNGLVTP